MKHVYQEYADQIDIAAEVTKIKAAKEMGNRFFQNGCYDRAKIMYRQMLDMIATLQSLEQNKEVLELKAIAHYNLAQTAFRTKDVLEACVHVEEALKLNPSYLKAQYLSDQIDIRFSSDKQRVKAAKVRVARIQKQYKKRKSNKKTK